MCNALSDYGHPDLGYMLLFNTKYPSWLYAITKDATTIWERWDGIKPDDSFQDIGMNSFNHYAYGAVGNWLYTRIAGIQTNPENPGYKEIIIKPVLTDKLKYAEATHNSLYGEIKSKWEWNEKWVELSVTIPANTKAEIFIPSNEKSIITENGVPVENVEGIISTGNENKYLIVETGSGSYVFTSTLN